MYVCVLGVRYVCFYSHRSQVVQSQMLVTCNKEYYANEDGMQNYYIIVSFFLIKKLHFAGFLRKKLLSLVATCVRGCAPALELVTRSHECEGVATREYASARI